MSGFVSLWIGATDVASDGDWVCRTGPEAGQRFWELAAPGTDDVV